MYILLVILSVCGGCHSFVFGVCFFSGNMSNHIVVCLKCNPSLSDCNTIFHISFIHGESDSFSNPYQCTIKFETKKDFSVYSGAE